MSDTVRDNRNTRLITALFLFADRLKGLRKAKAENDGGRAMKEINGILLDSETIYANVIDMEKDIELLAIEIGIDVVSHSVSKEGHA
jgi:hypothetical protein